MMKKIKEYDFDKVRRAQGSNDVIYAINEFVDCYEGSSTSFAHIVLDDCNTSDQDIDYCLDNARKWLKEQIENLPKVGGNFNSPFFWERYLYDDLIEVVKGIVAFLHELKKLPPEMR